MSDTVIRVENLGKKYIIGHQQQERYTALRDVMANAAKSLGRKVMRPFGNKTVDPAFEEFWALKDVSFEVKQGDRVGIIGRNGAGKSTLLKILSRITEPTSGRVSIKGRVASLLEVGTGFHPELTGRENIFLNGAILGMGKIEIKKKFDEIVAFAEVEKFLDTPVKRYSSGMYVRLAFAVAAHLEPEILVVDEVLAVGDPQFQKKCLGKMEDVGKEGRTVLFVSHQMDMIRALCDRSILLAKGSIIADGNPEDVIESYLNRHTTESKAFFQFEEDEKLPLQIISGKILGINNQIKDKFDVFEQIILELNYVVRKNLVGSIIACKCQNQGQTLFMSFDTDSNTELIDKRSIGYYKSKITLPCPLLKPGFYSVTLSTGIVNKIAFQRLEDIITFEVTLLSRSSSFLSCDSKKQGLVAVNIDWEIKNVP